MANWAESPNINFSPYIPKVNLDLYGNAIKKKEDEFQTNVNLIQNQIDNVAGFDVAKDVHKQYLNEQMSQLKTNLGKLVGADFSKQAVVNQAGGMATKIAKDPILQNAVYSTSVYKQGLADLKGAIKDGKSSPSNIWDYQNQVQSWLGDGSLESTFSGQYTPYTDVRKQAFEALKNLSPDIRQEDIEFEPDGSLRTDMLRNKVKNLSPDKIKAALYTGLDSNALKQLDIDGRYNFSGYNPQAMKQLINTEHVNTIKELEDKKKSFNDTLSTTISGPVKNQILANISQLDQEIERQNKFNRDQNSSIDSGNVESVKSNLHTNRFFNQFANAFSYSETSQENLDNPVVKVQMEKAKMEQQLQHWQMEFDQKERHFAIEQSQKKKENGDFGILTTGVEGSNIPSITQEIAKSTIEDLQKTVNQEKNNYMITRIGKVDNDWYNKQALLYQQGKLDGIDAYHFKNQEINNRDLINRQTALAKIQADAEKRFPLSSVIPPGMKGLSFNQSGINYNFSPEEVVAYNTKLNQLNKGKALEPVSQLVAGAKGLFGGDGQTTFEKDWYNELTPKEKVLFNIQNTSSRAFTGDPQIDAIKTNLNRQIADISKQLHGKVEAKLAERNKFIQDEISTKSGAATIQEENLGNNKNEDQLKSLSYGLLDQLQKTGTGTDVPSSTTVDNIKKTIDKGDATYKLVYVPPTDFSGSKYYLAIAGKGAEHQQMIPLTAEQKRSLFGDRLETGGKTQFQDIDRLILNTGNNTTNFAGIGDPIKAAANPYFTSGYFSGVKSFKVGGDAVKYGGGYALQLYIHDPKTGNIIPHTYTLGNNMLTQDQLNATLNALNDQAIYEMLYGVSPTAENLKEIQNINKNPYSK